MPLTSRPQTLKQAKRAYRKSGATVRLSASEIAQAERRAALQERADRIKEREARRKANLKKREEKIARERDTAKRTGRPLAEDKKSAWKIGPSQLSLGGFLGGVEKPSNNITLGENPGDVKVMVQHELDAGDKPRTCMNPPSPKLAACIVQDYDGIPLKDMSLHNSAGRMPPPPRPQSRSSSLADNALDDCFPSNTQVERELFPSIVRPATILSAATLQTRPLSPAQTAITCNTEAADDLLACISTQDLDRSGGLTQASNQIHDPRDADILAQICTQDLDFEDEPFYPASKSARSDSDMMLAQICTQDLDFSDEHHSEVNSPRKDFDDDSMDENLEDLIMELEEVSAAQRRTLQDNCSMRAVCEVR